jgi:aromatic-L-amino-acid decarboxylase
LWFVIRNYGVDGLQDLIRSHIEMAQRLADDIAGAADFELLRRPKLSLLCFRYRPDGTDETALDGLNERLLYAVNDSGKLYVTHTRMNGKYAIRFVIGQTGTESRHVEEAWRTIQKTARGLA